MGLFILFTIIGGGFGLSFFFGRERFRLDKLLYSLWALSIGVASLQLSRLEQNWSKEMWLILLLFFLVFAFSYHRFKLFWQKKVKIADKKSIKIRTAYIILAVMTLTSLIANFFIFKKFGTLPILSSSPDKMRFIINTEVFGLWEYLSLLPRIFIPLNIAVLLFFKISHKWKRGLVWLNIIIGFVILSLYASRLILILPILMSFFIYLISRIKTIGFKKMATASVIVVAVVLIISIVIPGVRHYITYQDYEYKGNFSDFTYISKLSQLDINTKYDFLTPLYIIPAFNLQALTRTIDFYPMSGHYFGQYELSVFPGFNQVKIPWKTIFRYWWITATFLFDYYVDFGIFGIALAGVFWAAILSSLYIWAVKKQSLLSALLFGYFGFVVVMSIYINYFSRSEFYLDIVLLLLVSWWIDNGHGYRNEKLRPKNNHGQII